MLRPLPQTEYISLALSEHYEDADEEFKARILRDEGFINPKPDLLPWEAMAIRAEKVMRDLHDELVSEYGYPPYPPLPSEEES